jgi:2-dehydro-3-deoxygluconokinase
MGLYFLAPGAGLRPADIVYDREGSAFALADPSGFDWNHLLAGAERLHLSGITPALGDGPAQAAREAAEAAEARSIPVSFDVNYRASLWARRGGDARQILAPLIARADILFGNHRDIALLLGREFAGEGAMRRRAAAEAAFEAFPGLRLVASTARVVVDAETHRLSARIDARDGEVQTEEVTVSAIVDRIGAGDAFAAGVLHGLIGGEGLERAAHTGLALACLKHGLPGDSSLFDALAIGQFLAGRSDVRR